jgi:uncharacterized protein (DUF433 family)
MTQVLEATKTKKAVPIDNEELTQLRAEVKALRELVTDLQWKVRSLQHPIARTEYPHVIRIQGVRGGSPLLSESYVSVKTIVEFIQQGFSPEKIVEEYMGELTLAQVHESLAYYYRHQAEIDAYLKADEEAGEELRYISAEQAARRRGASS